MASIPPVMRAVMFEGVRQLRVRTIPVPEVGPGRALLKVMRASVCNGSDAALFSGRRKIPVAYPWMQLPCTIGHECAGEIVAIGEGIAGFEIGQRFASLRYGGAFADYQLVQPEEDGLFPAPDTLSDDEATFLEPMYATNLYMPYVEKEDQVVLMGLGPSGIMFLEQCLALGVKGLLCADRHPLRLEIAKRLGARETVNTEQEDIEARVRDLFGKADAFIDATGWDVYDTGVHVLRPGGKIIQYGVPDSGVHYDGTRAFFSSIRFLGRAPDFKSVASQKERFRHMADLLDRGAMDFRTHVTHHFPLEQTPEAVRMAAEEPEKVLGMVIDVA